METTLLKDLNDCTLNCLTGSFDVIYADPPWRYSFSKSKSRNIENQYPTMTIDDRGVDVPSYASIL